MLNQSSRKNDGFYMVATFVGYSMSKKGNRYCRFVTNGGTTISVMDKYVDADLAIEQDYVVGVFPRVYDNEPYLAFSVRDIPDEDVIQ